MKLPLCSLLAVGVCGMLFAADEKPADKPAPAQFKDARDKISYSIGVNIGTSLKAQDADVSIDELAAGLRDTLAGKAKLTAKEVQETIMAWSQEMRSKRAEKMKVEGEANKKA